MESLLIVISIEMILIFMIVLTIAVDTINIKREIELIKKYLKC